MEFLFLQYQLVDGACKVPISERDLILSERLNVLSLPFCIHSPAILSRADLYKAFEMPR